MKAQGYTDAKPRQRYIQSLDLTVQQIQTILDGWGTDDDDGGGGGGGRNVARPAPVCLPEESRTQRLRRGSNYAMATNSLTSTRGKFPLNTSHGNHGRSPTYTTVKVRRRHQNIGASKPSTVGLWICLWLGVCGWMFRKQQRRERLIQRSHTTAGQWPVSRISRRSSHSGRIETRRRTVPMERATMHGGAQPR